MADFEIVDIPQGTVGIPSNPVVDAMVQNIGKAVAISSVGRKAHTIRTTLRTSLESRGILKTHNFHSRVNKEKEQVIVWLSKKPDTVDNPPMENEKS